MFLSDCGNDPRTAFCDLLLPFGTWQFRDIKSKNGSLVLIFSVFWKYNVSKHQPSTSRKMITENVLLWDTIQQWPNVSPKYYQSPERRANSDHFYPGKWSLKSNFICSSTTSIVRNHSPSNNWSSTQIFLNLVCFRLRFLVDVTDRIGNPPSKRLHQTHSEKQSMHQGLLNALSFRYNMDVSLRYE